MPALKNVSQEADDQVEDYQAEVPLFPPDIELEDLLDLATEDQLMELIEEFFPHLLPAGVFLLPTASIQYKCVGKS